MDTMILSDAVDLLLSGNTRDAQALIVEHDPFAPTKIQGRNYSEKEKMQVFLRDGFVDRYSGKRLVNPGILKSITSFFLKIFPIILIGKRLNAIEYIGNYSLPWIILCRLRVVEKTYLKIGPRHLC